MSAGADADEMILAPEDGAVAGTKEEIEQHCGLPSATESELIWKILQSPKPHSCVLFPSDQCGPDVLFRSRNGGSKVIAVQIKLESQHLALSDFSKALRSLNSADFYKWNKKVEAVEDGDAVTTANRAHWLSQLSKFGDFEYHRLVFSALGFSPVVQYLVREYNQAQSERTHACYIHLLNLDDIRTQIGDDPYHTLLKACDVVSSEQLQAKGIEIQAHCAKTHCEKNVLHTVLLQRDWMALTEEQKMKFEDLDLEAMCKMRLASFAGDKTKLIQTLNQYKIEPVLTEECSDWDIGYDDHESVDSVIAEVLASASNP